MKADNAVITALHILAHLAGDDDALERFVALTGMDLDDLRQRADEPAVLLAVLEYYLGHEPSLLEMTDSLGLDPSLPAKAHHVLMACCGQTDE
tara:strand:+ start:145 stop:423 length:279 start_codon:yes stop_codon:yes gene_type:complete